MKKITFGNQKEKDDAVAEKTANNDAEKTKLDDELDELENATLEDDE